MLTALRPGSLCPQL